MGPLKVVRVFVNNAPDQWHVTTGKWGKPSLIACVDEESAQRTLALLEGARQVLWKLSHTHSPSGRGDDCRPGPVDRTDATVHMLREAYDKIRGEEK